MPQLMELIHDIDATTIRLPSVVGIKETDQLRDDLIEVLEESKHISLDGSHVESIDAAGLQLLTAFTEDVSKNGESIYWCGVSEVLQNAASQLGLTDYLWLTNHLNCN